MAAGGGTKAIIAAFFANLGIAIAKFVAFLVTGAASMLAESIHSVADTSNQGLLLVGQRRSRRGPTEEHPFGYGRVRYFYAFVVAVVLFLLGGVFAMYEGVEKLRHPHEVSSLGWAVSVLIFGLVLEGYSFRTAIVESNHVRGERGWWSFIRRAKQPELPVVLLEDLGAMVGLALALVGVVLAALVDPRWDALGSVAIGVLLTVIAVILIIEMKSLLIGESANASDVAAIREAITATPRVERLIHLRTQHVGPEEILVAAKIDLQAGLTFADVAATIDEAEAAVRARVPAVEMIYLEPDEYDPTHAVGGPTS